MSECCFRGKWKKEFKTQIYGCTYYNEPNSLLFHDVCPYKDVNVRKCEKFKENKDE